MPEPTTSTHHPDDTHAHTPSEKLALRKFGSRARWYTTVGLQAFLGLFFLLLPGLIVGVLDVVDITETRTLFALYGGLLLHRAVIEQAVRHRRDPWWIRTYMISTFPFGVSSAIVLGWASATGLMNAIIGWIWVVIFVAELAEFTVVLVMYRNERARSATPAGDFETVHGRA